MEILYLSKGYLQVLGKFGRSADSHVVVAVQGETGHAWSIMNGVVRCLSNLVL